MLPRKHTSRAAVALLLMAAQMASFAHLALTAHGLGAEGAVVELVEVEAAPLPHGHAGVCEAPQGRVGHAERDASCPAATLLRTPVVHAGAAHATPPSSRTTPGAAVSSPAPAPLAPLVVAPKASPPAAA